MPSPNSSPRWSRFRPFPDPRNGGILHAPLGPGVYDLRRISTGELVLYGKGRNCAARMCSLFPLPLGAAGRNNKQKRDYVCEHIDDIEYRTVPCDSTEAAADIERLLRQTDGHRYIFNT